MNNVYVMGSFGIPVKKYLDRSHRDLVKEAYLGTLKDAGLENGDSIGSVWSACSMMHSWKQYCIIGQTILVPLVMEGLLPDRVAINNVENACATGSSAFQAACMDVASGYHDVSLAIGFEKLNIPGNKELTLGQIGRGFDNLHAEESFEQTKKLALAAGVDPAGVGGPDRSLAMDMYSMMALCHMKKYGTTREQFAIVAAKNHNNGCLNPLAQYRFPQTAEEVLKDREVVYPLTRAMCSPMGDGAAAALVCGEDVYRNLPPKVRNRCVKLMGMGMSSGRFTTLDEPSLTMAAADRAYEMAGIKPGDVDFVECHDAAAPREIVQTEMLGLCGMGKGGALAESGETQIGGRIPVNVSGGLISRGHPIGATGLYMINELTTQLREEAGKRQVKNAGIGLAENGGGGIGIEEAACSVIILQKC